jgi:4-amino-4-deoxy-L-arabinose transferase-like glycosyltransferase
VRYGLQFPIWGDESFVALSLLDHDYADMAGPLRCGQVAPLLFLWAELAMYQFFGGSELALRAVPFLAGLASLPLFWRLCWRTLPPLAATFAVGILATAYWPVVLSCTLKPYAVDLFVAMALLVLAVEWLHDSERWIWLAALCVMAPVALISSFPAAFVGGAVSVALMPTVFRQGNWSNRCLYAVFNVSMSATFLAHYTLVATTQLGEGAELESHLRDYWADGFPPFALWGFAKWFALIHTGRMAAYPIGDANGASTLTVILALVGIVQLGRRTDRRPLAALLLVPFALNFLAAVLHKYPYGGCSRLSQHLAPAVCMLAGWGFAWLVERSPSSAAFKRRAVFFWAAALGVIPIVGMARDLHRPYKDFAPYWARGVVRELFANVGSDDPVVILNAPEDVDPVFEWLLVPHRDRLRWNGVADESALKTAKVVWVLRFRCAFLPDPKEMPVNQPGLMQSYEPHRIRGPMHEWRRLGQATVMYVDVYRWVWQDGEWREWPRFDLSFWPRR